LSKHSISAIIHIIRQTETKKGGPKPQPLTQRNYLLFAVGTVGSKAFRKLYYNVGGKTIDVLYDGDLSCAYFVTSVLKIFDLIGAMHTTVKGSVADLKQHGWKRIAKPREGAVIVWAAKTFTNGETHRHIGFYLGKGKAVSNSSKNRSPKIHAWDYRPVEEILWRKP